MATTRNLLSQAALELIAKYAGAPNLEIEVRFGSSAGGSTIYFSNFERLRQELAKTIPPQVERSTVVYGAGNIRRLTVNGVPSYQQKIRQGHVDIPEYELRVSVASELSVKPPFNFVGQGEERQRERSSFPFYNTQRQLILRVDLTKVTQGPKLTYEVEVEYYGSTEEELKFLELKLREFFRILYATNTLYTRREREQVVTDFNQLFGQQGNIQRSVLVDARNIQREDMVWGGIVGNPATNYGVSYKADGKRKLLVVHQTGIWLIYPPHDFNRVISNATQIPNFDLPKYLEENRRTVIDGELLTPNSRSKYPFLAFDTLFFRGIDFREQPFFAPEPAPGQRKQAGRNDALRFLESQWQNSILSIQYKLQYPLETVDEFFTTVRNLLAGRTSLAYPEDGLMFTPLRAPYNPHSERYPGERVLTKHPDVVKWKDPKNITIDFLIEWNSTHTELSLYSFRDGKKATDQDKFIQFTGSSRYPLTPAMIDSKAALTSNLPSGTVVEYEWRPVPGIFSPRLVRHDKKDNPNLYSIALANWHDLQQPITEAELTGLSMKGVARYHNLLKRELLAHLASGATILDIGSGRGGDLGKWQQLRAKVLAIEPNTENSRELEARAPSYPGTTVTLITAGGEESEVIENAVYNTFHAQVDALTLMLSLSFFWKDSATLAGLVRTIDKSVKLGGKVLFITIDRAQVLSKVAVPGEFKTSFFELTIDEKEVVQVYIPDTIVGRQTEYLVDISQFSELLGQLGFELREYKVADGERFLSSEQREVSSFYTYGYYERTSNGRKAQVESLPSTAPPPVTTPRVAQKVEEFALLPVSPPNRFNANSVGDDVSQPLKASWYEALVRIACIGDSNCLLHAVLKAVYVPYQNNVSYPVRTELAANLRRELGALLPSQHPLFPHNTYWEVNTSFASFLLQEIRDPRLVEELRVDYSSRGMQRLFNSAKYLGDEVLEYTSNVLNLDIYLFQGGVNDLHLLSSTRFQGLAREAILILGLAGNSHYELIGLQTSDGIQTKFGAAHPLIKAIQTTYNNLAERHFTTSPDFDLLEAYRTSGITDFQTVVNALGEQDPLVVGLRRVGVQ